MWITVDDTNLSIIRWDNMNVSHNFLESLWKQWFMIISLGRATKEDHSYMAVCQNLVPLVNIKIAGKWMFIPLKMVLIGIDPYPHGWRMAGILIHFPIRKGGFLGRKTCPKWDDNRKNGWLHLQFLCFFWDKKQHLQFWQPHLRYSFCGQDVQDSVAWTSL